MFGQVSPSCRWFGGGRLQIGLRLCLEMCIMSTYSHAWRRELLSCAESTAHGCAIARAALWRRGPTRTCMLGRLRARSWSLGERESDPVRDTPVAAMPREAMRSSVCASERVREGRRHGHPTWQSVQHRCGGEVYGLWWSRRARIGV